MDPICTYGNNSSEEFESEEVGRREVRQVYLITYSQADNEKFPTRESFAQAVIASFRAPSASVLQWCCSREPHKLSGIHYHMCLKLNKPQRWLPSKRYLNDQHNISVHFSSKHKNYFTAWKYVSKQDKEVVHSINHPDLSDSAGPSTMKAHEAKIDRKLRKRGHESNLRTASSVVRTEAGQHCVENSESSNEKSASSSKTPSRHKRLKAFEVSEIVINKNIKSCTDLLALAHEQKLEGKTNLAEFIVNRGSKVINEVISTAREMETAKETKSRSEKNRLELAHEASKRECTCERVSKWYDCAIEILNNNRISHEQFANSVTELLEKGRGKYRNLLLTGPANSGKTFLLNPLNLIYKVFTNPASTSFAWLGAEEAEVVFLNDFRWSPQIISWHDLLLMLEGQLVHLPAPKSHYSKDLVFDRDTPVFATSKFPLAFVKNGAIDERETEMMSVRWRLFNFNYQIPREQLLTDFPSCSTCFCRLILRDCA